MGLSKSGIDYLTHVWQVAVGCKGTCAYCWARKRWARRIGANTGCDLCSSYTPHIHPERWGDITPRQKPKRIGVGFFADLCGHWKWENWPGASMPVWAHGRPTEALLRSLAVHIRDCPQHQFFTLTRYPENISRLPRNLNWPDNWWIGVTVTTQEEADRLIPALLASGVRHPWVSYEPARGATNLAGWLLNKRWPDTSLKWLEWVVAGGMTGKDATPSHPDWFRRVRDDCVAAGVPYYFKQWGKYVPVPFSSSWEDGDMRVAFNGESGPWTDDWCEGDAKMRRVGKKAAGHLLDGREWREMPEGRDGD